MFAFSDIGSPHSSHIGGGGTAAGAGAVAGEGAAGIAGAGLATDHWWWWLGRVLNSSIHYDGAKALTPRAAECIVLVDCHSKTEPSFRELTEFTLTDRLGPAAFDGDIRGAIVRKSGALVHECCFFRRVAMHSEASEILNCWLAATLRRLVHTVFTSIGIVEMTFLTVVACMLGPPLVYLAGSAQMCG